MAIDFRSYNKKCKSTLGGVKNFYVQPFVYYNRTEIMTDELDLIKFPDSNVFKFECEGSYSQQSGVDKGGRYFDQNVSIQLSEVYNQFNINRFFQSDFRIILETNNKDILMLGTYNGMECSVTNSSGANKTEFNGFNVEFKGKEKNPALLIEDLSDLGITIIKNVFLLTESENYILTETGNKILS